jgi:hypothetical protein
VKKILFVLFCLLIAILIFGLILYLLGTRPEKGALQITSAPKASVYIDDKLMGETPLCLCDPKNMPKVGDYTIRIVPLTGNFEPFQRKIKITPKVLTVVDRTFAQTALAQASIISLTPIDDRKDAQVSVISFPVAADVYLDSILDGKAPVLVKNQTESDHEIKVSKEGYKDKTIRIRTVLGYKLEAVVYLGIDPAVATQSAARISTPSATAITSVASATVLILQTPTGFLRVRRTASVGGEEIGRVNPGETYSLTGETDGWYQIELKDKTKGWISSQYAKKQS